ncbi:hypothetical protein JCM11641_006459 [Rhodosporidiobolus odoratus]
MSRFADRHPLWRLLTQNFTYHGAGLQAKEGYLTEIWNHLIGHDVPQISQRVDHWEQHHNELRSDWLEANLQSLSTALEREAIKWEQRTPPQTWVVIFLAGETWPAEIFGHYTSGKNSDLDRLYFELGRRLSGTLLAHLEYPSKWSQVYYNEKQLDNYRNNIFEYLNLPYQRASRKQREDFLDYIIDFGKNLPPKLQDFPRTHKLLEKLEGHSERSLFKPQLSYRRLQHYFPGTSMARWQARY